MCAINATTFRSPIRKLVSSRFDLECNAFLLIAYSVVSRNNASAGEFGAALAKLYRTLDVTVLSLYIHSVTMSLTNVHVHNFLALLVGLPIVHHYIQLRC